MRTDFPLQGPYERSEERKGYADGLKDRSFKSSVAPLALRVPQTRDKF